MKSFYMRKLAFAVGLAGIAASASANFSAGQIQAGQTPALKGDMAWGGEGDWQLSNGKVCAVVSGVEHEGELAASGGYLTDLGYCDRPGEGFGQLYFVLNLSAEDAPKFESLKAEQGEDFARIVGRGSHAGFDLKASYELNWAYGDRLQLKLELHHRHSVDEVEASALGWVNLNRGNAVFSGSLDGQGPAPGFKHRALPSGLLDDLDGLVGTDIVVSLPDSGANPMAYGQRIKQAYLIKEDGQRELLPSFMGVTDSYAAGVSFSEPFAFDNDGRHLDILKLLETQLIDLPVGHSLVLEQEISLAAGRDVASILNNYWQDRPLLQGDIGQANVPVFLRRADDGGLVNHALTNAQGKFALRAPSGDYTLELTAHGRPQWQQAVELSADTQLGKIELAPVARLLLPKGQIMRLTFIPEQGQSVDFSRQRFGFETGGKHPKVVRDVMLAGTDADTPYVDLAPGKYRVIASRGPEYSAHEITIELGAPSQLALQIPVPERRFTTPGYVNADLHTHSAPSFDNSYPQQQRIISYLAQGGEVLVPTEHDTIYDMAPDVAALGLSGQLATVMGIEITGLVASEVAPFTLGHANAFPVKLLAGQYRSGAVAHEARRWRDVFADLKQQQPGALVQLNHARSFAGDDEIEVGSQHYNEAYLMHLLDGRPYDPSQPLTAEQNKSLIEKDPLTGLRDIDFDALELINGTGSGLNSYRQLREDWFSLLKQGEFIVGTATSDSHGQAYGEVVLEPRTLVALKQDSVANFKQDEFIAAIKRGDLYGTTGPLLQISLADQSGAGRVGMGRLFKGAQGILKVVVEAADWVPVNELRVFVNGELVQTQAIKKGQDILIPLNFSKDSFVTIEVEGERQGLFADIVPVITPFAFTNPIYVDADNDGSWTAPGL